jgi:hypothetical protein
MRKKTLLQIAKLVGVLALAVTIWSAYSALSQGTGQSHPTTGECLFIFAGLEILVFLWYSYCLWSCGPGEEPSDAVCYWKCTSWFAIVQIILFIFLIVCLLSGSPL